MGQIEMELKLRFIDPDLWEQVFASSVIEKWGDQQSFQQEVLEARYFDTPGHNLQNVRIAYRIRQEGGKWVATVKGDGSSSGGLHQREEWTVDVDEPVPNIEPFMDLPIGAALQEAVGTEMLTELFTTRFERQSMQLHTSDGSCVELAADRGEIQAGERKLPIMELELELISGNPAALLQLGAAMAKEFPLLPEGLSKFHRALLLAELTSEQAPSLVTAAVEEEMPARAALCHILIANLQALIAAQEAYLQNPENPQCLQQMHLQLHGLNALMQFAGPLWTDETYVGFQNTLQQWEQNLLPLRALDITLKAWQKILATRAVHFDTSPVLGQKLSEKRADAGTLLHQGLNTGSLTPVFLELWAWLAEQDSESQIIDTEPTLQEFSSKRVSEWLQELIRLSETLDTDKPELLQQVLECTAKIQIVMEQCLPKQNNKTQKLLTALEKLHKGLKYFHVVNISRSQLTSLLRTNSSRLMYRDTGILKGWQAYQVPQRKRKLRKRWEKALRAAQSWVKKVEETSQ